MADDRLDGAEFRRLLEGYTRAFEDEDNGALAGLHTPDAVMVGPVGNVLAGRDAIMNFLQRAQRIQSVRFDPSDTREVGGDAVRQVGEMTLTVRGQGRETRAVPATFLALWVRKDGAWRIDTCVWSRRLVDGGRGAGRGAGGRGRMGGGRGMGAGMGGGGGMGGRGGGAGRGGRAADESSDAGEGGFRRGRQGAREGGAFNPRNLNRDDQAPLIPRQD